MADKIIALYGVMHTIVRVVITLRDAIVRDHLNDHQLYIFDNESEAEQIRKQIRKKVMPIINGRYLHVYLFIIIVIILLI